MSKALAAGVLTLGVLWLAGCGGESDTNAQASTTASGSSSGASTSGHGAGGGSNTGGAGGTESTGAAGAGGDASGAGGGGGGPSESPDDLIAVGLAEYNAAFLRRDGTVWVASQSTVTPIVTSYGLTNIVGVGGGQYHTIAWDKDGRVFSLDNSAKATEVTTDADGAPFVGNTMVKPFYQANISIRGGELYYWGKEDPLNQVGGAEITKPIKLDSPAGAAFVKVEVGSPSGANGLTSLWGLDSNGKIWQWDRAHKTAFQVNVASKKIADIAMVGPAAFVALTTDDRLYAWGYYSTYAGTTAITSTPTDVTDRWKAAGVVFPIRELVGNYNTLHIIDANDHLFGSGSNTMGEVGTNAGYAFWRTHDQPFAWSWLNGENMVGPTQIPGKYRHLQASTNIAFYLYVQDLGGNWYSWGRNKSYTLGNGISIPPYGASGNNYATYPNALDVHAPTPVAPLTQTWTLVDFVLDAVRPPMPWAGVNQYLAAGTTSTSLTGSVSQQQPTSTVTVTTTLAWSQVSGPSATIAAPASGATAVTGLSVGSYVFRLTATNSKGLSASQEVTVSVGQPQ